MPPDLQRVDIAESATYWCDPERTGLEFLRAVFVTHAFPRHTHENQFVIGVVERGVQECLTQGSREYLTQGTLVLLNPSVPHTGRAFEREGYAYRAFYPDLDFIHHFVEQTSDSVKRTPPSLRFRPPYRFADPLLAKRLLYLHAVLEAGRHSFLPRLTQDTLLYHFLSDLFERFGEAGSGLSTTQSRTEHEPVAVRRARERLDATPEAPLSLQEIAQTTGLSAGRLLRAFHQSVGVPPHTYQIQARVQRAKALLLTGVPVAEVAARVGFHDQSHLTRHFKRLLGVAPGAFQRASRR